MNQRFQKVRAFVSAGHSQFTRYERHISALAMVAGFAIDNFAFGRIDRPGANIIFCAYLALAVGTIALAHLLQTRADRKAAQLGEMAELGSNAKTIAAADEPPSKTKFRFRWLTILPVITQFALGGLWSGFLVFYLRSAVISASWPFVLVLFGLLIGNEVFRRYHARLIFASLLLFFALYSYAIFLVPILTGSIGQTTFLLSGALATATFAGYLLLLRAIGKARYRESRLPMLSGFLFILAAMNVFYFTGILPPLPLALSDVGVYHAVKKSGNVYQASGETQSWTGWASFSKPKVHLPAGSPLYVYSAVFAPVRLTTRISHHWEWYDPARKTWETKSIVSFAISGGRDGGYRAYSMKSNPQKGNWRVDIDTSDGRVIGRLRFSVVNTSAPVDLKTVMLQ